MEYMKRGELKNNLESLLPENIKIDKRPSDITMDTFVCIHTKKFR